MKGLLIRVAIDSKFGKWNSPVYTETGKFFYVPIPEDQTTKFREGLNREYSELIPEISKFCQDYGLTLEDLRFPDGLRGESMHLDPDFQHLTYGDESKKANQVKKMKSGDLIAFYAGLRSINPAHKWLVYAIIGLYIIDEIVEANEIPKDRCHENAHSRRIKPDSGDVIVRAKRKLSGRLEKCIPIGEWRDNAYRVTEELLKRWGGITSNNGFIQRSATLPRFNNPEKFYNWFLSQKVNLIDRNN